MRTLLFIAAISLLAFSQTTDSIPPESVPQSAQWVGGCDGESWVHILPQDSTTGLYTVELYRRDGSLWSRGSYLLCDAHPLPKGEVQFIPLIRKMVPESLVVRAFDGTRIYLKDENPRRSFIPHGELKVDRGEAGIMIETYERGFFVKAVSATE